MTGLYDPNLRRKTQVCSVVTLSRCIAAIADSALTALGTTDFEASWNEGASLDLHTALAAAEEMKSPT